MDNQSKKTEQFRRNETVRFCFFGGAGVVIDEHPSGPSLSPSKASSISSSGILSMLKGFLLALMIIVKWSSYR